MPKYSISTKWKYLTHWPKECWLKNIYHLQCTVYYAINWGYILLQTHDYQGEERRDSIGAERHDLLLVFLFSVSRLWETDTLNMLLGIKFNGEVEDKQWCAHKCLTSISLKVFLSTCLYSIWWFTWGIYILNMANFHLPNWNQLIFKIP